MKTKKIIVFLAFAFWLAGNINAQVNLRLTPTVRPTQGGSNRVGNLQFDYTIGEAVQTTLRGGNLVFTQGFEQPEKPLRPVLASQEVCSDTAHTFTFAPVYAGTGGDQVEWSLHSNFDTSYIIASGDTIQITVNAGDRDTIWLRSRAMNSIMVSEKMFVELKVSAAIHVKTVFVKDTLIERKSETSIIVFSSDSGIRYDLRIGTSLITSKIGNGDTLLINTGAIDSNVFFNVLAIDTISGCEIVIADSLSIKVFMGGAILNTTLHQLMSLEDPNYYQIVDSLDELIEELEEAEERGILVYEDEGFEEFYGKWKFFWENRVQMNDTNPGSFLPTHRALMSEDYVLPSSCDVFESKWKFEGPDIDPLSVNCTVQPNTNGRQQNNAFVVELWVDPGNNNIIIAAVPQSGLWRTANGGDTWQNISRGSDNNSPLLNYGVTSFTVKPDDHDVIYVSTTLENNGVEWDNFFTGIFFTTDGGETWQKDATFELPDIVPTTYNLLSRPKVSKIAFAPAPNQNLIFALGTNYAFKKDLTDGNWAPITSISSGNTGPGVDYKKISFDPNNSDHIFIERTDDGRPQGSKLGELYYSHDAGETWTIQGNFLDALNVRRNFGVSRVSMPSADNGKIYAFVSAYLNTGSLNAPFWNTYSIYEGTVPSTNPTTNNSIIWTQRGNSVFPATNSIHVFNMDFTVSNSTSSITNNPIMYMPADRFAFTDDFGNTRKEAYNTDQNQGLPGAQSNCNKHADTRHFLLLQSDNNEDNTQGDVFYMGTDGGITFHPDGGCDINTTGNCNDCLQNLNGEGISGQCITDFDFDPENPDYFVYTAAHHGLTESTSGNWNLLGGGDAFQAEMYDSGGRNVLWSNNDCTSSCLYCLGCSNNTSADIYFTSSLAKKPVKVHINGNIYMGGHNFMVAPVSNNLNFSIISNNTTATPPLLSYDAIFNPPNFTSNTENIAAKFDGIINSPAGIKAFNVNEMDDETIYIAFPGPRWRNNLGLIKSEDGGDTWENLTSKFRGNDQTDDHGPYDDKYYGISDITTNPTNADEVWISFDRFPVKDDGSFHSRLDRVWRSCDGGDNWADVSTGLPPVPVNKLLITRAGLVFAATTAGVYRYVPDETEPCTGSWLCMSAEMPPVPVIDLEFDECKKRLYAGTVNWGIWSLVLPSEIISNEEKTEITTDVTWNSSSEQYKSIVIYSGHTLRVTGSTTIISMARGTSIIVEPGAKLFVDDEATITNTCGDMWDGIIVKGDKLSEQRLTTTNNTTALSYDQGFVYIESATVENALEALRVYNPADGGVNANINSATGGTGGIVRASHAIFRNNHRSAQFMWYRGNVEYPNALEPANLSYFHNCLFERTTADNDPKRYNKPFVTLWGVNGVQFLGCEFENNIPITTDTVDKALGNGIITFDAGIVVDDYVIGPGAGGPVVNRNKFKNLQNAILLQGALVTWGTRVMHAQFENCTRGIRNEGVNSATFVGNDFVLGGNPATISDNYVPTNEGIILRQCSGFTVEQNTFTPHTTTYDHVTVGIRADGTGDADNEVYNNNFNELMFGNLANRQNQNNLVFPPVGLQYLCNINTSNPDFDIAVTEGHPTDPNPALNGIRIWQGRANLSAGNEFSDIGGISDFANWGTGLQYFHYNSDDLPQNITAATVTPQSPLGIGLNDCPVNFALPDVSDPVGGCIVCLTYSGYAAEYSGHQVAYNTYSNKYNALIDGGNTSRMLALVDTATNAIRLRDTLLIYAPNLSTLVLDSVATSALPNDTQKYQIFKANPEGITSTVMKHWRGITAPVPQWMRDSVIAAIGLITHRSYLLDTVLYHSNAKQKAVHGILKVIAEDTAGFDIGTYRTWLDSADGLWAKREKVNTFLYQGNFDTISAVFAHYDTIIDLADTANISFASYKNYALDYVDWMQSDSSLMNLSSTHLEDLLEMAEANEHVKGSQIARNVLNFFYDSLYFTPPQLPETYSFKTSEEIYTEPIIEIKAKEEIVTGPLLKLYPNPAQNIVTIEYSGLAGDSKLVVVNVLGEIVDTRFTGANGKMELNTTYYQNGVYLARIEAGNIALLKSKFIVQK